MNGAALAPLLRADDNFCIESYDFQDSRYCRVTIRLSWPAARRLVTLFAPFMASVGNAVDLRTAKDIEKEAEEARIHRIHQALERKKRVIALKALKAVYQDNIHYYDFVKMTNEKNINGYEFSIFDNGSVRHYLFHKARRRMIKHLISKGMNQKEVALKLGMTKQKLSAILNKKNASKLPKWSKRKPLRVDKKQIAC